MKKFKEDFVVFKDANGQFFVEQNKEGNLTEVKLSVRRPNHTERQLSDFEYNKNMNKLFKEGIMPRVKLDEIIRETGIWSEEKERKERELSNAINDGRTKLKQGKIKISEAAEIAKQGIKKSFEWIQLNSSKNQILNNSAENISEQLRFNYLVSCCTVYNDSVGNRYFRDYEDFLRQDNLGNPVTYVSGAHLSRLLYDMEEDFRNDWPEYQFLKKYGFVNDKFQFVNKEGQVVDEEGKLIELKEPETLPAEPEFLPD